MSIEFRACSPTNSRLIAWATAIIVVIITACYRRIANLLSHPFIQSSIYSLSPEILSCIICERIHSVTNVVNVLVCDSVKAQPRSIQRPSKLEPEAPCPDHSSSSQKTQHRASIDRLMGASSGEFLSQKAPCGTTILGSVWKDAKTRTSSTVRLLA